MFRFDHLVDWGECLEGSFENNNHIEVHVCHFDDHENPCDSTVKLIFDGEEYGPNENENPVDDIDGRNNEFVLKSTVEILNIHFALCIFISNYK